jgi:thermitase
MRRQTRIIGGRLVMRDKARLAGLFSDLRWLLLVVLTGLVGLLTSAPVHPTGLPAALTRTSGSHASGTGSQALTTTPIVPGYVLVRPRPGLPPAAFAKVLAAQGGKAIGQLNGLDVYVVALPKAASPKAVARALAKHPHIKFAEPDALVPVDFVPNDTDYANEWHLRTIGAPSAWDVSTGSGITVAILDSGVDATHPDLVSQMVPGWNFYDNNSNTSDVYGHGTKVAGVVAALGNNSMGVAGVAFNARLMPIRVTDTSGYASISALANGLTYAADHGARVANMSFAVQSYSTVIAAAQYFMNKGGVVMNSAGNSGVLDSTAPSDALVSVSATGSTDVRASWSTYGPYVDVAAPGVGIWTTTSGGGYGSVSGTSFSSPLTAGVAALMMSANPHLAPSQIVSMLKSSADDLGTAGFDNYYGYGRVDASRAVSAAIQTVASDTSAPAVSIAAPTGGTVSGIVPVNVNASDNVGVTRVDLLVNGVALASDSVSPYGFSWDTSALIGTSPSVVARAYDAAGNVADSSSVKVSVSSTSSSDVTAPSVSITSPTGGTVSGIVAVGISATDNVGVARVELLVNGNVVASDTSSPFALTWDSSAWNGTNPTLSVRAYDAAGNSAMSKSVTVSVTSGAPPANPDTTAPVVKILSPANGSRAFGNMTVSASATDNVGVATVSLSIDGMVVATSNGGSVSYRWNTKKVTSGMHTITVLARDTSGNQATASVSVTH